MKPDESAIAEAQPQDDYDQPVAYDAEGRPLYAHPPIIAPRGILTPSAAQQVVHIARAIDPIKQEVSDETKKRHDRSTRLYPSLNLSEHEYVISAIRRHPIGLVLPFVLGIFLITIALTILSNYPAIVTLLAIQGQLAGSTALALPLLIFCGIVTFGMYVVYYVYSSNKFFLTNESVIQEIQLSLFSRHEQSASLENIEDVSYYQDGLVQQIFNYGSIRLSTQGDETTYRFTYVSRPKQRIATLNNAVEAFKNGRPVDNE